MSKRALILKGGTMRGAYTVGALKIFHKILGVDYFDLILATSVGVYEQAFFASGQIYFMENTWKEYVSEHKLLNIFNPLKGKPILDLDYLVGLFQSEESMLDLEKMRNSHPRLLAFVTDYENRKPTTMDLKNGPIFDIMRASCALPYIYPKKVLINGKRYVDSWMAKKEDFTIAIEEALDGYDEVFAISCFSKDTALTSVKTKKITVLYPSKMPVGTFDTNRRRLIETLAQGEKDAEKFIIENKLSKV